MVEHDKGDERFPLLTAEGAQVVVDSFRDSHPGAAAEIGQLVDSVIHGTGDDVPDLDRAGPQSGASVSPQTAQAAVEFVIAAMLMASR